MRYVVGLAFDAPGDNVILIRKERPSWQQGFLNGPGGKVEPHESSFQAMVREYEEETGLAISDWEEYAILHGSNWAVIFYRVFDVDLTMAKTMTDEEIGVYPVYSLPPNALFQLRWLIPLALDNESGEEPRGPTPPTWVTYGY